MKTSNNGIDLIKKFEGCVLKAYLCPAKVLTIGYGHTGKDVVKGMVISQEKAIELLRQDLAKFETAINQAVKVQLTQSQFDALVSFTYNVGIAAFKNSTMLKFINQRHFPLAAGQFDRWVKANGTVLKGLVNRRAAEKKLFLS